MHSHFQPWLYQFRKSWPQREPYLLAGVMAIFLLSWFFTSISPKEGSLIIIGISLIVLTLFCFLQFLLNNVRRSIIICVGGAAFLFLRSVKLADPLYIILLIFFLISLELSTRNR